MATSLWPLLLPAWRGTAMKPMECSALIDAVTACRRQRQPRCRQLRYCRTCLPSVACRGRARCGCLPRRQTRPPRRAPRQALPSDRRGRRKQPLITECRRPTCFLSASRTRRLTAQWASGSLLWAGLLQCPALRAALSSILHRPLRFQTWPKTLSLSTASRT